VEAITLPTLGLFTVHLHISERKVSLVQAKYRSYGFGSYWKFPGGVEIPRRMERTFRSHVFGKNFLILLSV